MAQDGDGLLSFKEASIFHAITVNSGPMSEAEWKELCEHFGADPAKGMDIEQFKSVYKKTATLQKDYDSVVGWKDKKADMMWSTADTVRSSKLRFGILDPKCTCTYPFTR